MSGYAEYREVNLPWLKAVPAHWEIRRNKNIFTEQKEIVGERSADYTLLSLTLNGIIPRDMDGGGKFPESFDKYKIVKNGDMAFCLFDIDETPRTVGLSGYNGMLTGAYTIMRVSNINARFIYYYYLALDNSKMLRPLYTGLRKTININTFQSTKVPVPPREEQDQIVRFLDWKVSNINKLINIKQEQLRTVKELLDRLFRDTTSKCSKKVKIKYLFELDDDFFVPDASESYAKAGMYNRGRGIFLREPCLGNELGDSQFQHIHSDCLMLSGQFAWEDAVYITQEKDTHGIASHRYYLLKPVRYIPVEYLWLYFLSGEGFFNLQQCSHGSAGRNRPLNIKEVINLELPVPDDKEKANALNELVRDYMRLQVITEEEKKALLDFQTHLIADIVTGKIDVRGIEIPEYEFVDEDIDNADENLEQGADEPPKEE